MGSCVKASDAVSQETDRCLSEAYQECSGPPGASQVVRHMYSLRSGRTFRRTLSDILQDVLESARELASSRNSTTALPMHINSAALILTVFVSAGFGQLSWLIAARLFSPSDVGVASAVITG